MPVAPDPAPTARFASDLDRLAAPGAKIGIAVSGGPDSVALLLLAAAARPGEVEAASVDHALRPDSASEAQFAAGLCEQLGVPHTVLRAEWSEPPTTAIQQRARAERYRLLGNWLRERKLAALATGHHADDQAETLLMRLTRGAGVRGLAAIRAASTVPGSKDRLVRPLLGWRRSELENICAAAGVEAIADPSNSDPQFERVRVRNAIAEADWLDPKALARSAANLAAADVALEWASAKEWARSVKATRAEIAFTPGDAPLEIRRRIAARAIALLAREGNGASLRGPEVDRLIALIRSGRTATLRGVRCSGGDVWRFVPAPARRKAS